MIDCSIVVVSLRASGEIGRVVARLRRTAGSTSPAFSASRAYSQSRSRPATHFERESEGPYDRLPRTQALTFAAKVTACVGIKTSFGAHNLRTGNVARRHSAGGAFGNGARRR